MNVKLTLIILIILTSLNLSVFGARQKDTVNVSTETDNSQIIANLDSLLNSWYVKNCLKSRFDENKFIIVNNDNIDYPDSVYIERLLKLNSIIDFSYNTEVKNIIDLYAKRRRNLVGVMLGLSEYYFPLFEKVLDANDMPQELRYLPVIESALNPRAVSKAGATGIWQFMYVTGKQMGLRINSFVDERRDPIKSSDAAAKYLKLLYKIYGDWNLAIAAYNCGPGNVNKAIKRSGGKTNFWEIYNYLPRETRGYIPAFIAANYIMTYYQEHNIVPQKIELFQTDTMVINDNLHLEQVAAVLGVDINLLRDLNPQYKKDVIPAKNENYTLVIPHENVSKYIDLKDSIFAYKDSIYFNPKKIHFKPSDLNSSNYAMLAKVFYTVKPGDNVKLIAKWFNADPTDISQWNKLRKKGVKNGQKLAVFVPKDKVEIYKKLNSMSFDEKQLFASSNNNSTGKLTAFQTKKTKTEAELKEEKEKEQSNKELEELKKVLEGLEAPKSGDSSIAIATVPGDTIQTITNSATDHKFAEIKSEDLEREYFYYTVKTGDTIWSIARSFSEVTNDIMKLNNLSDADILSPGQKLKIKKKK